MVDYLGIMIIMSMKNFEILKLMVDLIIVIRSVIVIFKFIDRAIVIIKDFMFVKHFFTSIVNKANS